MTDSPSVILSVAKNLVPYHDVSSFLRDLLAVEKVVLGCWSMRFFAALRMTKGDLGCLFPLSAAAKQNLAASVAFLLRY